MRAYFTIFSLAFLFALFVPFFSFAASTDATLGAGTIISVGGYSLVVSGTATFDSISVNADTFTVDMSIGSELIITSTDRRSYTVSPNTFKKDFSCGSSQSTLTLGNTTEAKETVTVTPSSSACSGGGGGGGASGGGGGGGGGGGYSAPAVPAQAPAAIPSTVPAPSVAQPSSVAKLVSPVFNTALRYGVTSDEVKKLQELLASDPDIYPEGIISGWFGQLTRRAVQRFQTKHGIVSSGDENTTGYGALGPKTRQKIQEVFSEGKPVSVPPAEIQPPAPSVAQPSPVAVSVSPVFNSGLSKGMTHSDIKRLQQLLNSDPETQIASSGTGSPGNETEYFGSLTEKAVQKFQMKYGVAKEGDPGYGYIGPKTRSKLQEIFSGAKPAEVVPEVVSEVQQPAPAPVTPAPTPTQTGELPEFLKMIPAPTPR